MRNLNEEWKDKVSHFQPGFNLPMRNLNAKFTTPKAKEIAVLICQ